MRVLVACPTYEGMDYCLEDFLFHVRNIDYPDFKVLLVDNSRSKKFFKKLSKIKGVKAIYDDTDAEDNLSRLISSRNKILDYAFSKGFDYLLMLDADVMVRSDVLERLLGYDKDVVSGLYFNIFNVGNERKLLPVCYKEVEVGVFEELMKNGQLPSFVNSRHDLRRNITKEEIESGKLLDVLYPSGGCLLLSRNVLSSGVKYRRLSADELKKDLPTSDDIPFFIDLKKEGFVLYCDPQLICSHDVLRKYGGNSGVHPISE